MDNDKENIIDYPESAFWVKGSKWWSGDWSSMNQPAGTPTFKATWRCPVWENAAKETVNSKRPVPQNLVQTLNPSKCLTSEAFTSGVRPCADIAQGHHDLDLQEPYSRSPCNLLQGPDNDGLDWRVEDQRTLTFAEMEEVGVGG